MMSTFKFCFGCGGHYGEEEVSDMYVFQGQEVNDEPEESDWSLVGKTLLPNAWNTYC